MTKQPALAYEAAVIAGEATSLKRRVNERTPNKSGNAKCERLPNQTPPLTASRANGLCIPKCEACGNDYDKAFEIVMDGERHIFDSFECAIHALAPVCPHCNCRIMGHGVEADGQIFCCVHCARASGTTQLKDRA